MIIMSFMPFESAEERLIRLLKYADIKTIRDYVIKNPSINLHYPTVDLKTPLIAAINRDNHQILSSILDRIPTNLDDTMTYPCGRTALMYSAYSSRNPEILQVLLKKGADIQKTDARGWTCLFYAVVSERLKTVTFLLEHGATINARDLQERTPLMISAYLSNVSVLLCLLNYGADIQATDNAGYNALELAILWCKREAAMVMLEKYNDLISHLEPALYELAMTILPNVFSCFGNGRKLGTIKKSMPIIE